MNGKKLKKLRNKKGLSSILIIIVVLIILLTVSLILQIASFSTASSYLSQTSSFVARTLGSQGGTTTYKPHGYDGEYITSQELYDALDNGFINSGFVEWRLLINNREFRPGMNYQVPEKNDICIILQAEMEPLAESLGSHGNITLETERIICSSFEERTQNISIIK